MANNKLIKELGKDIKALKIERQFYKAVQKALKAAENCEKKLAQAKKNDAKHLKECKSRDQKLKAAEEKNAILNNDIGTLQEMLKQDREAFDKEISKLKSAKGAKSGKDKSAEKTAAALEEAKAKIKALKAGKQKAKLKVEELEGSLEDANGRIDNLGTAIASANDRIAELQGSMEQDFEAYNIELKELNGKLSAEAAASQDEEEPAAEEAVPEVTAPKSKREQALDRIRKRAKDIDFDRIGTASESDKDDLKLIKGIGPYIESKLNALGIFTFQQVSNFSSEDEDKINKTIEFFPGRVKRDQWPKQALDLMAVEADSEDHANNEEEE